MYYPKFLAGVFSLIYLLILTGCGASRQTDEVNTLITHTKEHFVPDSRVDRFDVQAVAHSNSLVLTGETTLAQAKSALFDSLSKHNISAVDSINVLPASDLQNKTYALVNNSVANIRSEPGHPAQLATQALLGMPLKVLKKHGGWYYVKTPDDYLSWVDAGGIVTMDSVAYHKWANAPKIIYTKTYGFSYEKGSESSEHLTDLVAGNILKLEGKNGRFYKVSYPDGRNAFVAKTEAKPFEEWSRQLQVDPQALVQTAKTMMGAPYLWGGTSTKGIDCSGFTKTIYFMNGRIIPRDASQQVRAGVLVDSTKNWYKLNVGDLLFFGHPATDSTERRVVHVGMWIGNDRFIHSSEKVRISSVDSTAENYDPYNVGRYLQTRRYLQNWKGNIMQTSNMYDLDASN